MRVACWPHVPDLLMTEQDLIEQNRDLIEAVKAMRWELGRLVAYALDRSNEALRKEWVEAEQETTIAMGKVWRLL